MSEGWHLPPVRQGIPADAALIERRARAAGSPVEGYAPGDAEIGGVRCLIVVPEGRPALGTILYLHGGGYRLGSPMGYINYARRTAEASGWRLVIPFYRLAPEHPFPAALHDAVAVYRALHGEGDVVVAGDSAGGGLSAALCIAAARAGERPAGAILLSPMLDLTARAESHERNAARDQLFSHQAVLDAAGLYLQGHAVDDPLVSPIFAAPSDFPPVLLLVGGAEVLLDESLDFVRQLALADRRVTLHFGAGMGHVWPLMDVGSHAAAEAFAAMACFVNGLNPVVSDGSK